MEGTRFLPRRPLCATQWRGASSARGPARRRAPARGSPASDRPGSADAALPLPRALRRGPWTRAGGAAAWGGCTPSGGPRDPATSADQLRRGRRPCRPAGRRGPRGAPTTGPPPDLRPRSRKKAGGTARGRDRGVAAACAARGPLCHPRRPRRAGTARARAVTRSSHACARR